MKYRDFWDVPRSVAVEYHDRLLLFDCPFDDELDDYPDAYTVYSLDPSSSDKLNEASWECLPSLGKRMGTVSLTSLEFDESRRQAVSERSLTRALGELRAA